jgi:hypothetical protein
MRRQYAFCEVGAELSDINLINSSLHRLNGEFCPKEFHFINRLNYAEYDVIGGSHQEKYRYIERTVEMRNYIKECRLLGCGAVYTLCETAVHTRSIRRHIPEDGILYSHRRENLKSHRNYIGRKPE